ncbi:MAG: alpha-amylase family glycosyl hydrolase [Bacteroidota bacterium]
MKKVLFVLVCLISNVSWAQSYKPLNRVDPPFWWNNLNNKELQLQLYGKDIASNSVKIINPKVKLVRIEKVESPDYLYVYVNLQHCNDTQFIIQFTKGTETFRYPYKLQKLSKDIDNITQADLIYLAMPDRFANGDTTNDVVAGLREDSCNRNSYHGRHGGDLQGVINHLDYLDELGVTALWLNPTLINDQPKYSYHGYALTDHYKTDPRFGTNADYKKLGQELKKRHMKLIMDLVPNHIGDNHWMFLNMPEKSFVNQWSGFTRTNYRATTHFDPYASTAEKKQMVDGWFDNQMPDINQRNPRIAIYLMQSYLWWINYAGIDGFRIDTYSYNDYEFMNKCMDYIKKEYPNFWSSGEIWERGVLSNAYFTQQTAYSKSPKSNLTSAIDFNLHWAIHEALLDTPDWDKGTAQLYRTLTQDGLYNEPHLNMTFLDNHDLNRFYSIMKNDIRKFKMGIGLLLTLRGVPSIYYGTELLVKNPQLPRTNDGQVRMDFEGAWPGDKQNKFTAAGRTEEENEAFKYVKKLANWRKNNVAITQGKTLHFAPNDGVYVYFRYTDTKAVMVILNRNAKAQQINFTRFSEILKNYTKAYHVINDQSINLNESHSVLPDTIEIIELEK